MDRIVCIFCFLCAGTCSAVEFEFAAGHPLNDSYAYAQAGVYPDAPLDFQEAIGAEHATAIAQNDHADVFALVATGHFGVGGEMRLLAGVDYECTIDPVPVKVPSVWAECQADCERLIVHRAKGDGIVYGKLIYDVAGENNVDDTVRVFEAGASFGLEGKPKSSIHATYYGGSYNRWVIDSLILRNYNPITKKMEELRFADLELQEEGFSAIGEIEWPVSVYVEENDNVIRSVWINKDPGRRMFAHAVDTDPAPVANKGDLQISTWSTLESD